MLARNFIELRLQFNGKRPLAKFFSRLSQQERGRPACEIQNQAICERANCTRQFAEVFSIKRGVFMRLWTNRAIFILTEIGGRV
jgi:hypothetical protein